MALARLIDAEFGIKTRVLEKVIDPLISTTAVKILNNNPDRLGFLIVNMSNNTLYVALDGTVSASRGIIVASLGGFLSVFYKEDFVLAGREIWAVASGADTSVYIIEVEAE